MNQAGELDLVQEIREGFPEEVALGLGSEG